MDIRKEVSTILLSLTAFAFIGAATTLDLYLPTKTTTVENEFGHTLWRSKSEESVLLDATKNKNYSAFVTKLSRFGRHEWSKFTEDQKLRAMERADGSQVSPDEAVFIMDRNY